MTADKAQLEREASREALPAGARDDRGVHARSARIFAEAQHRAAKAELDAIRSSAGWALLQKLYPLRFRLLPRGSRREAAAQWAARRLLRRAGRTLPLESSTPADQSPSAEPEAVAWPRVSIVIVTCNNIELNELCLQAVLADTDYPDYEVIVVDNGSSDGTQSMLERVAATAPALRVVLQTANLGFARACNAGASIAGGDVLCFLNNDTVVHGRWLRSLVMHLCRDPGLGLVGPTTNAIDNEARVDVGYGDLDGMRAWTDAYCAAHSDVLESIAVLAFFCVVVPRAVWERVGPLDEQFSVGMFEDDDYCRRVRAEGFEVKLARDSFVHHWQGASFRMLGNDEYLRIRGENEKKFRAKWTSEGMIRTPILHGPRQSVQTAVSTGMEVPPEPMAVEFEASGAGQKPSPEKAEWEFIPEGWSRQTRDPDIKGWDVGAVAEAYKRKWPSFLRAIDGPGPLGVAHETPEGVEIPREDHSAHGTMMALGYVLALAARTSDRLSILDWGGGPGHYYLLSRALIPGVDLDYHVEEVPGIAALGRELLPEVHFTSDSSCLNREYDLVLASGSLQYAENWQRTLADLAAAAKGYLFITRLPVAISVKSFVVVQRPYRYGYGTEYLGWVIGREELLDECKEIGMTLVREFILDDSLLAPGAPESPSQYRGFLLQP